MSESLISIPGNNNNNSNTPRDMAEIGSGMVDAIYEIISNKGDGDSETIRSEFSKFATAMRGKLETIEDGLKEMNNSSRRRVSTRRNRKTHRKPRNTRR
jgi:hypothetical protein